MRPAQNGNRRENPPFNPDIKDGLITKRDSYKSDHSDIQGERIGRHERATKHPCHAACLHCAGAPPTWEGCFSGPSRVIACHKKLLGHEREKRG